MLISKEQTRVIIVLLDIKLTRLDGSLLLLVPPREDVPVECGRRTDKDEITDGEPVPEVKAGTVSVQLSANNSSEALYVHVYMFVNASRVCCQREHSRSRR